jgi:hypothetical protein
MTRLISEGNPIPSPKLEGVVPPVSSSAIGKYIKEPPKNVCRKTSQRTTSRSMAVPYVTPPNKPIPTHQAQEHLIRRQKLQEARDAGAPPLPDPGGLGFSPGAYPEEGDHHMMTVNSNAKNILIRRHSKCRVLYQQSIFTTRVTRGLISNSRGME